MKHLTFFALVFIVLLTIFSTADANATTWHVPFDAPTIQAGIDSCDVGDIVEISCGTYFEHDIILKGGITLRAPEAGGVDCVIVDAQQQGRVFYSQDQELNVELQGLTITGGLVPENDDFGGAFYCENTSLLISHCIFRDNYAGYAGGAIYIRDCPDPNIESTTFIDNEAYMSGGAIYQYQSDGTVFDCHFESNIATDGAGIMYSHSAPDIGWCTFLNNQGMFFGGAIFFVSESGANLTQCDMVGNKSYLGSGFMLAADSDVTVENCIIAHNIIGAGIHVFDIDSEPAISCCNVFGNQGGQYDGEIFDQTGANGNLSTDPLFCDWENGDLTLRDESPCRDVNNDCQVTMGAAGVGCGLSGIRPLVVAQPLLMQNYPNPFNPITKIGYSLPQESVIELRIFDLAGREVRVLRNGVWEIAGFHEVVWDSRDNGGRLVPSGIYYYCLQTNDYRETRPMVLLK
ncbi:MAG: hypothetical protein GY780_05935 [bacterium]|nr:hypothetical protein [bacterium]